LISRGRALDYANQRNHQYATLEHLLLALIDDADASAVMKANSADVGALKEKLVSYLDNELERLVTDMSGEAVPTPAFQRVDQRAALYAQGLGRPTTGEHMLRGIFPETRSPAVRFMSE